MLYDNNFTQLDNKNMKINVLFYSSSKLLSVIYSFVTGNRHLFSKVPTIVSQNVLWQLSCISFLHDGNILAETFSMFVAHCKQIGREDVQVGK